MRTARIATLLALLAASPAALGFEGVMDVKMSHRGKIGDAEKGADDPSRAGSGKIYLSKSGVRMEWQMGPTGQQQMKVATLVLRSKPQMIYFVNDSTKTYSEHDSSKNKDKEDADDEKFSVKKLPNERVAGYDCTHGIITTDKGNEVEVWTSKDVGDLSEFINSQTGGKSKERGWERKFEVLKGAGLTGWPMKWAETRKERQGEGMVWEVVHVEKGSPPASLFDLSGYKKTEGFGPIQLSAEQQKKMEEAMKKMTPEQRQQMEKMMKGQQ